MHEKNERTLGIMRTTLKEKDIPNKRKKILAQIHWVENITG